MNNDIFVNLDEVIDLIFPLLNEYDIGLWEDIQYVDLAEEWVRIIESKEYRKLVSDVAYVDLDGYIKSKLKEFFIRNCTKRRV